MTRILYIGFKYDYGKPERGFSFEYVNFFETLARMNDHEVVGFHYDEVMRTVGRLNMNARLLQTVEEFQPEVCFFNIFTDEIEQHTIRVISNRSGTVTINWFGDDHWRFEGYSRRWAPFFHWVVTTDIESIEKYHAIGCRNVVKSQWGFNPFFYKPYDVSRKFDVSFVGQVHSTRRTLINKLSRSGIHTVCWGRGWPNGRLSQGEMVRLYSQTKINLNFVESSAALKWKPLVKVFLTRRLDDSFRLNSLSEAWDNLGALFSHPRRQIKGRIFEIPGSGGFLLTQNVVGLQEYFEPGKEIATFEGIGDLAEQIRYYLRHEDEREAVRVAGYQRALRDHTFEKRLRDILREVGISRPTVERTHQSSGTTR
jgi:spore maturation protein CgeB